MKYGRNENPTYNIFFHLDANVSFSTQRITWENLTRKVIMGYFLDTLKLLGHSKFTTQEPW